MATSVMRTPPLCRTGHDHAIVRNRVEKNSFPTKASLENAENPRQKQDMTLLLPGFCYAVISNKMVHWNPFPLPKQQKALLLALTLLLPLPCEAGHFLTLALFFPLPCEAGLFLALPARFVSSGSFQGKQYKH